MSSCGSSPVRDAARRPAALDSPSGTWGSFAFSRRGPQKLTHVAHSNLLRFAGDQLGGLRSGLSMIRSNARTIVCGESQGTGAARRGRRGPPPSEFAGSRVWLSEALHSLRGGAKIWPSKISHGLRGARGEARALSTLGSGGGPAARKGMRQV
jgi:hypothetical protein